MLETNPIPNETDAQRTPDIAPETNADPRPIEKHEVAISGETKPASTERLITCPGPVVLTGPAATGKTAVLVHAVKHRLEAGMDPASIAVLSAAPRVPTDIRDRLLHTGVLNADAVRFDTLFGFILGFVRNHHGLASLPVDFAVQNFDETHRVLQSVCKTMKYKNSGSKLSPADHINNLYISKRSADAGLYANDKPPTEYGESILSLFELNQTQAHSVTVWDLWLAAIVILRHPDAQASMKGQFRCIIVDNLQLANAANWRLLAMIGDLGIQVLIAANDDQAVRPAPASRATAEDFVKDFPGASHFASFLTAKEIGASPNAYFRALLHKAWGQSLPPLPTVELPRAVYRKAKEAKRAPGTWLRLWNSEGERATGLAIEVTKCMTRERDQKTPWQAILCESKAQMISIRKAFSFSNISLRLHGDLGREAFAHIDAVLAHLQVLETPTRRPAWVMLLELCRVGAMSRARLADVAVQFGGVSGRAAVDGINAASAEAALAHVADRAARDFPAEHQKVSKVIDVLRNALKENDLIARYDIIRSYCEPIIERRYKGREVTRIRDLAALRTFAGTFSSAQQFLDSWVLNAPELLVTASRPLPIGNKLGGIVDVGMSAWAMGLLWPQVHVLCPPLARLFNVDPKSGDSLVEARRKFISNAAARAPDRLVLHVVRSSSEKRELAKLERLAAGLTDD